MERTSKRTDRVKYVDPVTGLTEYRYVEKVTYRYEDEEKVPIVIEFLTGESSAEKMVEKYHCGICVDPHSVEDFKNAIEYLLTHKKEAYEMGQNGRRAVIEEFSWDSQAKGYLKVMNALVNE